MLAPSFYVPNYSTSQENYQFQYSVPRKKTLSTINKRLINTNQISPHKFNNISINDTILQNQVMKMSLYLPSYDGRGIRLVSLNQLAYKPILANPDFKPSMKINYKNRRLSQIQSHDEIYQLQLNHCAQRKSSNHSNQARKNKFWLKHTIGQSSSLKQTQKKSFNAQISKILGCTVLGFKANEGHPQTSNDEFNSNRKKSVIFRNGENVHPAVRKFIDPSQMNQQIKIKLNTSINQTPTNKSLNTIIKKEPLDSLFWKNMLDDRKLSRWENEKETSRLDILDLGK